MTERAGHASAMETVMRIDALDGPAPRLAESELDAEAEALADLWLARGRPAGAARRRLRALWLAAAVVAVTGSVAAMWAEQRALPSPSPAPAAPSRPRAQHAPRAT